MLKEFKKGLKSLLKPQKTNELKIKKYVKNGCIPWSEGYNEFKWKQIELAINDENIIDKFKKNENIVGYGVAIDERIVEYPWIISNLSTNSCKLLDAGSTFNFKIILNNKIIDQKEKTILTYFPERFNFNELRISYVYSDLREMPFRDSFFAEIVCQSTIEHIDMDNSIYGYKSYNTLTKNNSKSYEYLKAIKELVRILKSEGTLLLTFPYGVYENHNFFQQFDSEMTEKILKILHFKGSYDISFFKYNFNGWQFSSSKECDELKSYNPHTGRGKGTDGAAHCRGICCIKFKSAK